MIISDILKEKHLKKNFIIKKNKFKNNKYSLWFVFIESKFIDDIFLDALKILPSNFVVYSLENNFDNQDNISFIKNLDVIKDSGFDFFVTDNEDTNILKLMKSGIVPIVSKNISLVWSFLKEFNASNVSWNSFIFDNDALCDIYYSIIRYLENAKFSYDNRALVKNVLDS